MFPAFVPSQMTVAGTLAMGSTLVRRPLRVSVQPPGGGSSASAVAAGVGVCALTLCSKGSAPGVAGTMLMRAIPAGLRLPKMLVSLETSLSGQLGFQVADSSTVIGFLIDAVPRSSGSPFTRLATTSLFFSVATSALV